MSENSPKILEDRIADPEADGMRLDRYIAERIGLFPRSQIGSRVVFLRLNGKEVRRSKRLKLGDFLEVAYRDPPPLDLVAEPIPFAVLFENGDAIVVDKPQGLVVHPGSGNAHGTLVNGLLHHCAGLGDRFPGGDARPGIVHRLDKETSGVLIAAKNPAAHAMLAGQFRERTVRKSYLAIVSGRPLPDRGRIETRIARHPTHRKLFCVSASRGRAAVTSYTVLRRWGEYALVLLRPRTGRTHQLRVHMKSLGAPILGDPLYGAKDPRFPEATLMLHARRLRIVLPGDDSPREFTAPVPDRFHSLTAVLKRLPE
jgi:23S rRNA pseudouridine1911/1915/1917 synthase